MPQAQYTLGLKYFNGMGVKEDKKEGAKWFLRAAYKGHLDAMCDIGLCYLRGDGVEKSYTEFVEWLGRAANQDHARSKRILRNYGYGN